VKPRGMVLARNWDSRGKEYIENCGGETSWEMSSLKTKKVVAVI
jgi:hypothetical protein